mmetsp:Transcript_7001/g.15169  ORF Transcript_7001/g.15169 Transcript_7001/m.15169 type:complete len:597 (+) Transcript_7001:145-1935(+)
MSCLCRCSNPAVQKKDDGEWMEPIKTENSRHVSQIKEGQEIIVKERIPEESKIIGRVTTELTSSEDSTGRDLGALGSDSTSLTTGDAINFNVSDTNTAGQLGEAAEDSGSNKKTKYRKLAGKFREIGKKSKPGDPAVDKLRASVKTLKGLQGLTRSAMAAQGLGTSSIHLKPKVPAVTSITALRDGYFLTASRYGEKVIKMHKIVGEEVEFVREFKGHSSGVTALVTLDKKGRFLSAGVDKTVTLWDSRFNCEEDSNIEGVVSQEPTTLLAKFNCFERYVHSIGVLNEGSFVRPTDGVDMAMVAAMAKKTAWEGAASVQRAAIQREIIQCSGSFATSQKNDKNVNIWEMTVGENSDEDAAKINLADKLEHDTSIAAMAAVKNAILAGDIMGVVHMWGRKQSLFRSWGNDGNWTKLHVFTPWKNNKGIRSPLEISEQSILNLCLLDGGTFVCGTRSGVVRVWDNTKAKDFVVYKKHATSLKVTSETVTGIQKLPSIKDPNTGEECMAFSVASSGGKVMSIALQRHSSSKQVQNGLHMFNMYSSPLSFDGCTSMSVAAISSIAVSEVASAHNGKACDSVLIAGDGNGKVETLSTLWAM